MFNKVLVANRGEIACRVIRALKEMSIKTVAVCSEADRLAKHVTLADEAHVIGPAPSSQSYLVVDNVIEAARSSGAEAIHPGYGFLSESETLREACDAAGIVFIGPTADAMRAMGQKTRARQVMDAAGVPIVPGTTEAQATAEEALSVARGIGFPVLLKASAGGGGKGMRLVESEDNFANAFESCGREAQASFGDAAVYVEKAILEPRHIEIQVLADKHGNAVHVFERECSVQRRHQKVIEEAPAAILSSETREKMGAVAVKAAQAIGYEGAGTVEFLVDSQENFWFLEMNTRLQVEHPVTELVTGLDLVHAQVRIAYGEPLGFKQSDLSIKGHAIECRLYAEDPFNGFLPSPGVLTCYRPPAGPGIRVDDGVNEGDSVSTHYDPMLAKIITWAPSRSDAISRMRAALRELRVGGIKTNVALLDRILTCPAFVAGKYDTSLIATQLGPLEAKPLTPEQCDLFASIAAVNMQRELLSRRHIEKPAQGRWSTTARDRAVRRSEAWSK